MASEALSTTLEPLASLDRAVHEPARLQIMAHLYALDSADFLYLLGSTGLTRGNLSSHMRKLEGAGYVEVEKKFVDRLPLTIYHLTETGRTAFSDYRAHMLEALGGLTGS